MRHFVLLFCIAILISGCSKHQYLSFSSDLPTENDGSFIYENDSVKVVYSFLQEGNLQLEITNKLNDLIYIDLNKSAIIINNESFSLDDGLVNFNGQNTANILGNNQLSEFSGQGHIPTSMKYIHPNTKINHVFKNVPIYYGGKAMDRYVERPTPGAEKRYLFSQENSSHHLESFLYLDTDKNESNHTVVGHSFWVSEFSQLYTKSNGIKKNQFHSTTITPFGVIIGSAALTGLIVLVNSNAKKNFSELGQ